MKEIISNVEQLHFLILFLHVSNVVRVYLIVLGWHSYERRQNYFTR